MLFIISYQYKQQANVYAKINKKLLMLFLKYMNKTKIAKNKTNKTIKMPIIKIM